MQRPSRDQPFGPPSPVLAADVAWPSLSPDELELYYQQPMMNGVYRRTRASTTIPFDGNETLVISDVENPDVSSDGTKLYFNNAGVFVMTRTCN